MSGDGGPEWARRLIPETPAQLRRARRIRLAIVTVALALLGSAVAIIAVVGIEFGGQAAGFAVAASLVAGAVGFAAGSLR